MSNIYIAVAVVGAAALIVGSFSCVYQLYKLVQVDAECRGLKHPKLWGLFAISGNGHSGLILYLIGRRKYPILSISEEQKKRMGKRKKGFGAGLLFLATGAIVCVLSMFLSGKF